MMLIASETDTALAFSVTGEAEETGAERKEGRLLQVKQISHICFIRI